MVIYAALCRHRQYRHIKISYLRPRSLAVILLPDLKRMALNKAKELIILAEVIAKTDKRQWIS